MKRALLQRSQRLLIWLGLLPLVLALIAYRTSSQHVESVQATLATDQFIRQLDELLSTVQDAETGQRGYLLTGQNRYLIPFVDAKSKLDTRVAAIQNVALRNGVSRQTITDLRRTIEAKMGELEKTLELREHSDVQAALTEVETNRGQRYMEQIRTAIRKIKDQQTGAFLTRLDEQRRRQTELTLVLGAGVLLGFLLLFLSYRYSSLDALQRDNIEKEIQHLNESLESRVKERTAELEAQTHELEIRSIELQRSNADLLQFAYIASHDLQEPLRMVASYMGLLAKRYQAKLDRTADTYIKFAIDGAGRMQELIQDLLTYSRAGTQAIQKKPVSSKHVLQRALQDLQEAIKESLAIVHYGDLPTVNADETKLTQVMGNLIGNAIKFRNPNVNPEIWVTATTPERECVFEIRDNGIGFDPKYSDRIFQVFQRLHATGSYPGNGIGLAICRRLIEHHGGRLWVESQPGAGSKFFFTLPLATGSAQYETHSARSEASELVQPVVEGS